MLRETTKDVTKELKFDNLINKIQIVCAHLLCVKQKSIFDENLVSLLHI
jgi:hypothetical protein